MEEEHPLAEFRRRIAASFIGDLWEADKLAVPTSSQFHKRN